MNWFQNGRKIFKHKRPGEGGAETIAIREVSISRLGNNMVHNCDLSALLLVTQSAHWPPIGHGGPVSTHGALQTMNNPLCTLSAHRTPHTRLSPFHQFLELFVVLIVNTEQCLLCLQQLPRYFPHLDLTSQSICPDYFCRNKAILLRILKKYTEV